MDDLRRVLAENISELRKSNNLTQAEFAERLNYSDKAVSKWERGMAYPSMNTVIKMAELFQVSMDVVLGLAPIPSSGESA